MIHARDPCSGTRR